MKTSDILILPTDDAIRRKTAENVVRKYNNTDISLMYDRSPVELLDNLYMGDIAKNALAAYLRKHCSTPVTDYDEIRTDDFTEPDGGWDLMVGNSGIKAEVKSSIPPGNEADADIIARRDIKITAALDKENPVWSRSTPSSAHRNTTVRCSSDGLRARGSANISGPAAGRRHGHSPGRNGYIGGAP